MALTDHQKYSPLNNDEKLCDQEVQEQHSVGPWRRRFFILLGLSFAGLLSLAALCLKFALHTSCSSLYGDVIQPYSPINGHLQYVNRKFTSDPDTPKFMGKPRPELDEAWHDLLQGTLIRVSGDELQKAGNASSVEYQDGGFVAGVGISHSLHCLKRIKQFLYPDYYYSHKEQDWAELESHADHCIESLRQSIMCSADVSLYTLEWTRHSRYKPTVRVPQAHACVDWSKLHEWMLDRAALLEKMVPPPEELFAGKPET